MANSTTVFVTGKVYWAKIVGEPHNNYEGTAREWSYDFVPDDVSFLKEHRLLDRLKDKPDPKNPDKGEYLVLRKPEFDRDGNKNPPITIYNENNEPWDGRLLGNGTSVDAKLKIVDWGRGKKKSIYTTALRVKELVPYVSNEFGAMDAAKGDNTPAKSNPRKEKAPSKPAAELDELDDDLPF